LRAKNRTGLTISFWKENVDRILHFHAQKIIQGKGTIGNAMMEKKVEENYKCFDARRKTDEALQADQQDLEELEKDIQQRKRK